MENRIEVPIANMLLDLIDRMADIRDDQSLILIDTIILEIIGTGIIISADDVSFIDLREYIEFILEAIESNTSVEDVKSSPVRTRFN